MTSRSGRRSIVGVLVAIALVLFSFAAGLFVRLQVYPQQQFARLYDGIVERAGAPGIWIHRDTLIEHEFRDIVKPNVDTLYSTTVLDLRDTDYDLEVSGSTRYWSVQMSQENTDVFGYVGSRTHGYGVAVTTRITRDPGIAVGSDAILAPSDKVWLLARFEVEGPTDVERVRTQQQALRVVAVPRK